MITHGFRVPAEYTMFLKQLCPVFQTVELTLIDHNAFDRFFFGFTGAAGSEALDAEISQFQLSFIRPDDDEVTSDPTWLP